MDGNIGQFVFQKPEKYGNGNGNRIVEISRINWFYIIITVFIQVIFNL